MSGLQLNQQQIDELDDDIDDGLYYQGYLDVLSFIAQALRAVKCTRNSVILVIQEPSLRANGSRECAPDDRLREAIHRAATRKNGLLRRFAPRNDVSPNHRIRLRNPASLRPCSGFRYTQVFFLLGHACSQYYPTASLFVE